MRHRETISTNQREVLFAWQSYGPANPCGLRILLPNPSTTNRQTMATIVLMVGGALGPYAFSVKRFCQAMPSAAATARPARPSRSRSRASPSGSAFLAAVTESKVRDT